jgi:hypothetical protein
MSLPTLPLRPFSSLVNVVIIGDVSVRPTVRGGRYRQLTVSLSDTRLGKLVNKRLREVLAEGRGGGENRPHAGEVKLVRILGLHHGDHDRGDDKDLGDALGGNGAQHGDFLVPREEDNRDAVAQRALVDHDHAVDVRVGKNTENLVLARDELFAVGIVRFQLGGHVVVRRHDALGQASGAGRVAEEDGVVDLVAGECLGLGGQAAEELEHGLVGGALGLVGG